MQEHSHKGRVLISREAFESAIYYDGESEIVDQIGQLLQIVFKLDNSDYTRIRTELDLERESYVFMVTSKQCPAENYPYKLPVVEEGTIIPIVGHIKLRNGLLAFIPSD